MSKKEKGMAISDFNMQLISPKDYEKILTSSIEIGTNVSVFGRRGSGKTEIAKQVIANAKINGKPVKEVYINLSVAERTDMGGYPDMFGLSRETDAQKRDRFVNMILPKFFESMIEGDQPVVALFDEVDKADTSIWAPLLEIVQFKSINGKPLKNLRCCIMTGNLISEGGARPSLPLLDRSEKYLIQSDVSSFLDWAGKSGKIHPTVISFLYDRNDALFGEVDAGDHYADSSPRGWYNASQVLFQGEERNWDPDLINMKIAGFVGKKQSIEYASYYQHYRVLLPLANKVFDGKFDEVKKKIDSLDPSHRFILSITVCSRLAGVLDAASKDSNKKEEKEKAVTNVGKFVGHVDPENVLMAIRSQIQILRVLEHGLDEHPLWKIVLRDINEQIGNKI